MGSGAAKAVVGWEGLVGVGMGVVGRAVVGSGAQEEVGREGWAVAERVAEGQAAGGCSPPRGSRRRR